MGITVLPPDVNESVGMFTAVGEHIRFGMAAVRNVGTGVVDSIVAAREEHGKFTSFTDFLEKVPVNVCNKRTIESLIKAGGFDSLGHTRRSLLAIHEQAVDAIVGVKRKEAEGQFDLFAMSGEAETCAFSVDIPDMPEWEKKQKLAFEREMLGLYVSDHPLAGIDHILEQAADTSIVGLMENEEMRDGYHVTVAGLVTGVQRKMSRAGNPWAAVSLEDMSGGIEIMFFGDTYLAYSTVLANDAVIVVKGRLRMRDEEITIQALEVTIPDVSAGADQPLQLTMESARCVPPVVERLKGILTTHPGSSQVHVKLTNGHKATLMRLDDGLRVNRTPALYGELKALLGPNCLT